MTIGAATVNHDTITVFTSCVVVLGGFPGLQCLLQPWPCPRAVAC
jgi:hypothetical protein